MGHNKFFTIIFFRNIDGHVKRDKTGLQDFICSPGFGLTLFVAWGKIEPVKIASILLSPFCCFRIGIVFIALIRF